MPTAKTAKATEASGKPEKENISVNSMNNSADTKSLKSDSKSESNESKSANSRSKSSNSKSKSVNSANKPASSSNKPKKLNTTTLSKMAIQLNEKQKIIVLGEYEVQLHQTWRKSTIREVIMSYMDILQELNQQEDVTNTTIANSVALIDTLLVKAFTDIPFPKDQTDVASLIQITNVLLDNGILEEVIQAFHPDNIARFQTEFEAFQNRLGQYLGDLAIQRGINQPWMKKSEDNPNPNLSTLSNPAVEEQ